MSGIKSVLVLTNLFLVFSLVQCTEFVPVYMWSTSKTSEKVPALHKISQESFKDDVLERLKEDPFIVVFAEETLSPEDFAQKDLSGNVIYPNLLKQKKTSKITYFPYVQNPIKALHNIDEDVVEVSISSFLKNIEIPESKILIINLNDARDDEQRIQLLSRHDEIISKIYGEILKKHDNILALYTARHTSWVAPENLANSRNTRSLLTTRANNNSYIYSSGFALVYYKSATYKTINLNETEIDLVFSDSGYLNSTINVTGTSTNPSFKILWTFTNGSSSGYWQLHNVTVEDSDGLTSLSVSKDIYAPTRFSYHCGDQYFSDVNETVVVYISWFQIQLFFNGNNVNQTFYDAYDCVGFTTVPIWSGIFVTTILLLIMSFGITMIMDIKTMDRFDDPKGKTITVIAE